MGSSHVLIYFSVFCLHFAFFYFITVIHRKIAITLAIISEIVFGATSNLLLCKTDFEIISGIASYATSCFLVP